MSTSRATSTSKKRHCDLPSRDVLVLRGGGTLGAFQAAVYDAMHSVGSEPDWVVGTSIGAVNATPI